MENTINLPISDPKTYYLHIQTIFTVPQATPTPTGGVNTSAPAPRTETAKESTFIQILVSIMHTLHVLIWLQTYAQQGVSLFKK